MLPLHADPWHSPFLPVTLLSHNTMPRAPSWTLGDVLLLQSVSDVPAGNLEEKLEAGTSRGSIHLFEKIFNSLLQEREKIYSI